MTEWSPCYSTCLAHNFQVSLSLNASPHWHSQQSKAKSLHPINIPHFKKVFMIHLITLSSYSEKKTQSNVAWAFFLDSTCWMSHHQNYFSSSSGSAFPPLHCPSFPTSQHHTITRLPHTNVYCHFGCLDIRLDLTPPQQIFCFISNWKTLLHRYSFKWTFLIIQYLALHQMQTKLFAEFYGSWKIKCDCL